MLPQTMYIYCVLLCLALQRIYGFFQCFLADNIFDLFSLLVNILIRTKNAAFYVTGNNEFLHKRVKRNAIMMDTLLLRQRD